MAILDGGGGEMAMLDGGGRRPLWRERSSCWEPENPPCFCFVPYLFLFFLSSIWPLFSVPFSLLSSCFPLCHCLLSFSKNFAPPLRLSSSIYKQEKKEPPLLCPIVVQGGNGLPYLCRVRWPAVCRAWCPSLLFITLAGYVGAWAVVSFMQVGGR